MGGQGTRLCQRLRHLSVPRVRRLEAYLLHPVFKAKWKRFGRANQAVIGEFPYRSCPSGYRLSMPLSLHASPARSAALPLRAGQRRQLIDGLVAGEPVPAEIAVALIYALAAQDAGDEVPLKVLFGLKRQPGQRKPSTVAAQLARDDLLRQAAAIYFAGRGPTTAARLLRERWRRYADIAWSREGECEECPGRHVGRLEEFLWQVMRLDERVLSVEWLRRVLARR